MGDEGGRKGNIGHGAGVKTTNGRKERFSGGRQEQKVQNGGGEDGTSEGQRNSDPENAVESPVESLLHWQTKSKVLIRVNRDSHSNEIDESDLQHEKHSEQRISTVRGIMID
jgi:hypothetical protein